MKRNFIAEIIGWYGLIALVTAYGLASFDYIEPEDYLFILLNLTGSLAILVISIVKKVYQSVILNIFWAGIALVALAQLMFN